MQNEKKRVSYKNYTKHLLSQRLAVSEVALYKVNGEFADCLKFTPEKNLYKTNLRRMVVNTKTVRLSNRTTVKQTKKDH